MKVVVFGYNIFSPGGTTRSNLNLITEFKKNGNYDIIYYNYTDFSNADLVTLLHQEPIMRDVTIKTVASITTEGVKKGDCYFITKESFFPIAKIIRSEHPTATIIGEIHGPMDMLYTDFSPMLPYFSYIRVATESIKAKFIERFGFNRVYVQNVSLAHIQPVDQLQSIKSNNFVILSRFDEQSKDISYGIKLMDYLVNYLNHREIHLYLNGYGIGEVLYKNLINYYKLNANVHINKVLPKDYTYLSTSRYETFGYSIMEAIFNGHNVCLFAGNDQVVKENFSEFEMAFWLTKELVHDSQLLVSLTQVTPDETAYQHDKKVVEKFMLDYVAIFENKTAETVSFNKSLTKRLDEQEVKAIIDEVNLISSEDSLRKYRLFYYAMKKWPLVGSLVGSELFRENAKNITTKYFSRNQTIKQATLHETYIFVESFHGKNFSGDPKYLALALKKQFPESKIFVSSVNQLVDMEIRSYGFEALRTGSKNYLERFSECKYVIINGNSIDSAVKREGQVFIQTWHGFPMKKMVNDLENNEERQAQAEAFLPRMQKWDYLLTSSTYNTELFKSAFHLADNPTLKIIESGAPKNEYLIAHKQSEAERERIYWKYFNRPADETKKFILFCPTWRKDKRKNVSKINLTQVIDQLPENYEIIVKLHPNEGDLRKKYSSLSDRIHCFYNELVDIQELYVLADVLISDYSSAIFDYAHLNKRTIILQEDSEAYQKEVGWYFDIEKEFKIYAQNYTSKELAEAIMEEEDLKEYNQLFTTKLMNNDSLESAEQVINIVWKGK